jgi:hypothetical protein
MKANFLLHIPLAVFFLASGAVIALNTCHKDNDAALIKEADQLSYSMGLQIGKNIGSSHIDINTALFIRGLNDGRTEQQPALTTEQIRQTIETLLSIMRLQIEAGESAMQLNNNDNTDVLLQDKNTEEHSLVVPGWLEY